MINVSSFRRIDYVTIHRVVLLAVILIGFTVRLIHFGAESLWYDETFSAYLSAEPVAAMIGHTARDIHPPAYYLLLHGWRALAQPSVAFGLEFLLGWPSLVSGMLVIALSAALARRLFGLSAGLLAAGLAVLHPTQVWYAQEVRMYALASVLYLATLWPAFDLLNLARHTSSPRRDDAGSAIVYAILVAASLYTLYYSVFWLVALNIVALCLWWRHRGGWTTREVWLWLTANLGALILFLPWLPVLIRQSLSPPVAPWREPWANAADVWRAVLEAYAALWVGHAPPAEVLWPWTGIVAVVLGVGVVVAVRRHVVALGVLVALVTLPVAGLLVVSGLGPPIYFVRYVAPFAVLMPIIAAAVLIGTRPRVAGGIIGVALILIQAAAVRVLWTNPLFTADDHRAAVADLASLWRPGDVILVNAGWVYTAIATYWPHELPSPAAAQPPPLAGWPRLTDLTSNGQPSLNQPVVVRTGTVGGDPSLGWGLSESDFYALSADEAVAGIERLADQASAIWHYRLYDTVNDPAAVIRTALASNADLGYSQPYSGPGYLLLERYDTDSLDSALSAQNPLGVFAGGMQLDSARVLSQSQAGEMLYVDTVWSGLQSDGDEVGVSLRLVDPQQTFYAQTDARLRPQEGGAVILRQALPIPAAVPPGPYAVWVVVYDLTTLQPINATDAQSEHAEPYLQIAEVEVNLPDDPPHHGRPAVQFDYLALLDAGNLPETAKAPGAIDLTLTWMARASDYRDEYLTVFSLMQGGSVIGRWSLPLGTDAYPSSGWLPGYPVMRRVQLPIAADTPSGSYTLHLGLERAADGMAIEPRGGWLPWIDQPHEIGQIEIVAQ